MRLRTLEKAMEVLRPSTEGKGLCFHWSAAMVLDLELEGVELCIGILHENLIHAWVEYNENVYAPTLIKSMGGKLIPIPRLPYYSENKVRDVKRLSPKEVASVPGIRHHLTTGEPLGPNRALGDELMEIAGIRYRTSEFGTAIAI